MISRCPPGSSSHLLNSIRNGAGEVLFDERFLNSLTNQDTDAEARLIDHFSRPVRLKLRARLRSPELAEDAFQETFLRIFRYFRGGKTLDNPSSLPGFVHSVCHNVALELLRAHTRQPQIPEHSVERADQSPGAESQMVTAERRQLVGRVLEELSERDRQVIRRVLLDEEDKDAVCSDLQVDRANLRLLLHRARIRFRTVALRASVATGN